MRIIPDHPLCVEARTPTYQQSQDERTAAGPHREPEWTEPGFTDYLQIALEFRAWGFTTFPVRPDKRPACRWQDLQERRPTDRQIGRLFDRTRGRCGGVAVITGRAS